MRQCEAPPVLREWGPEGKARLQQREMGRWTFLGEGKEGARSTHHFYSQSSGQRDLPMWSKQNCRGGWECGRPSGIAEEQYVHPCLP